MEEFEDSQALDWALPAAAQAAEHSSVASFTAPTIEPGPNGFFSQLSSGENASKADARSSSPRPLEALTVKAYCIAGTRCIDGFLRGKISTPLLCALRDRFKRANPIRGWAPLEITSGWATARNSSFGVGVFLSIKRPARGPRAAASSRFPHQYPRPRHQYPPPPNSTRSTTITRINSIDMGTSV